jgi:glycosyltransferase involved in cell wall biosynthesis
MPKLSIITVNLNNKDGLIKTAESIITQSWDDYEWIIVDGGSTDGSVDVINEYVSKTSKITHWRSEKDDGIYHGMNRGIAKASGEYCYFLNSGDYLRLPSILKEIFAIPFDEDIIYGNMMLEDKGGSRVIRKFKSKIYPSDLLYGILPHQNMFIKTQIIKEKGGYRTDLRIVSDWVFYIEAICKNGASYRHIPTVFAVNQGEGISNCAKYWSVHKAERLSGAKELFSFGQRILYFFSIASVKNKIEKIRYRYESMRGSIHKR